MTNLQPGDVRVTYIGLLRWGWELALGLPRDKRLGFQGFFEGGRARTRWGAVCAARKAWRRHLEVQRDRSEVVSVRDRCPAASPGVGYDLIDHSMPEPVRVTPEEFIRRFAEDTTGPAA